jgi:hypothetical protein
MIFSFAENRHVRMRKLFESRVLIPVPVRRPKYKRVPGDRRRLHVEAPWEHNQEPLLAGTHSHGQCHHRDLGTNGEVASPRIVARQRPAAQCIAVH